MYKQDQLKCLLQKLNIYNPEILEKLKIFLDNLCKWNKSINLTSKNFDPIEHIERSFLFFDLLPKKPSGNLLDVGSGNGFPAIILAIACQALNITMIDSNIKKSIFLKDTCYKLSLKCEVINKNILMLEEKSKFDYITIKGLKINSPIEDRIYHLLIKETGSLILWTYPPPLFKRFMLKRSINTQHKYVHLYSKAQAEQLPK